MEEEKQPQVEIYDDESVIELFDENDQAVKFTEIASIELDGKFYELLQPVEPMDGIGEDEAVIFEYEDVEDSDERNFTPVFDEELLDRVFNAYLRAASELACECEECDCDECDCEECDCEEGECDCHEDEDGCDCGCHRHDHK